MPTRVFLVPPAQLDVQVEAVSTANTMLSQVTRQILPGVLVAFLSKNAGCPANFAGYPAFLNAFLSKIK